MLGLSASFVVVGGRDAAAVRETACLLLLPEVMADPPTGSESKRRNHGRSWQAGGGRDAAARLETLCLLFGSWLALQRWRLGRGVADRAARCLRVAFAGGRPMMKGGRLLAAVQCSAVVSVAPGLARRPI